MSTLDNNKPMSQSGAYYQALDSYVTSDIRLTYQPMANTRHDNTGGAEDAASISVDCSVADFSLTSAASSSDYLQPADIAVSMSIPQNSAAAADYSDNNTAVYEQSIDMEEVNSEISSPFSLNKQPAMAENGRPPPLIQHLQTEREQPLNRSAFTDRKRPPSLNKRPALDNSDGPPPLYERPLNDREGPLPLNTRPAPTDSDEAPGLYMRPPMSQTGTSAEDDIDDAADLHVVRLPTTVTRNSRWTYSTKR